MRITSFRGKHDFLSNFYSSPVEVDGQVYPTVEHAFQALKTADKAERLRIKAAKTPAAAKRLGKTVKLRADWEEVKVGILEELLVQKFSTKLLRDKLLATSEADLVEDNSWGDTFWGKCNGKGENNLGKLLMKVRKSRLPRGKVRG